MSYEDYMENVPGMNKVFILVISLVTVCFLVELLTIASISVVSPSRAFALMIESVFLFMMVVVIVMIMYSHLYVAVAARLPLRRLREETRRDLEHQLREFKRSRGNTE